MLQMNKKIIHILKGKANPDTMNGVNKVVHNLATEQTRQGMDVEVWGITATPNMVRHQHNYTLRLFKARRNPFLLDHKLVDAISTLPKNAVAHLHSVFLPELYSVSRKLKTTGLPWVLTPHGGYSSESVKKNRLLKLAYKWLFEDRLTEQASSIQALGDGEFNELNQVMPPSRVVMIPNGQESSCIQKTEYSNTGPLSITYCGRLAKSQKGLDILILAIAECVRTGNDIKLSLIGDDGDRYFLETLAKNCNVDDKIVFLGKKTGKDKNVEIIKADIFIHSSRWDGLPLAVLEAAAMGLPLLLSKPTNMSRYVDKYECGLVIDHLDAQGIARTINLACVAKRKGQLLSMGHAAKEMIRSEFSWEEIARNLNERLYSRANSCVK